MGHPRVAVLVNAGVPVMRHTDHPNIPGELRLVVTHLANSDICVWYETVHRYNPIDRAVSEISAYCRPN